MADSYLTFAADYDWLFDDDVLTDGGAINYPAAARLFQRTSGADRTRTVGGGTALDRVMTSPPRPNPLRGGHGARRRMGLSS